jgi:prolyl 4-hydroxylase
MERADIERVMRSGDIKAQIELGKLMELEGEHSIARGLFATAAKAPAAEAMRYLALNLLNFRPHQPRDAISMLKSAGHLGDAEALHLCSILAGRDTTLENRIDITFDLLMRAAESGHALAQSQVLLLAQLQFDSANVRDWSVLRDKIDSDYWSNIPESMTLSASPRIEVFDGFLRSEICDWLVARARPKLSRATVYSPASGDAGVENDLRTNSAATFQIVESDALMATVQARIVAATRVKFPRLEPASVLHYNTGEQYAPHFDFLETDQPAIRAVVARAGQRIATFLIYLNDEFEGGETEFIDLGIRYKGNKGDAVLFYNVDSNGQPDMRTCHAGRAPTSGEKWLFSQWLREPAKENT